MSEILSAINLVPKTSMIDIATYHVCQFRYFCFGAHFMKMMRDGGC